MPRRRKDAMTSVGRGFSHLHHRPIVTKEKPQQRNGKDFENYLLFHPRSS